MKKYKNCIKCRTLNEQICSISKLGLFNVDRAIQLIKNNKVKKSKVSLKNLKIYVENGQLNKLDKHINHVTLKKPVIIGTNGEFSFLFDGNHRAVKAFINNKTLFAYKLTPYQTGLCYDHSPPKGYKFVATI